MARKPSKRFSLGQNFIRSPDLVRQLISNSSIGPEDSVYEIGAGRGIITGELAKVAGEVIAIEVDPDLVEDLKRRFEAYDNVKIFEGDFLRCRLPATDYKVFANLPFNITSAVVRKLLSSKPGPRDAFLIMQKEAAQKFAGEPEETQFSVLEKPFWRISIVARLRRIDFDPAPAVDPVLLRIERRVPPLVQLQDQLIYRRFVRFGYGRWKKSLKLSYKPIFTYTQWKRLSQDLDFSLNATPTDLSLEQWIGLFKCFKEKVPKFKRSRIMD